MWILLLPLNRLAAQSNARWEMELSAGWKTVAADAMDKNYNDFAQYSFNDASWLPVTVPHNWDQYEGLRRMKHGNRHGYAWYRNLVQVPDQGRNKRYLLFFEGVGSYATVLLNGKLVGKHAGGRTTFTIDITEAVVPGKSNLLAVRADHPAGITDLPWVCGGCSAEIGFSEGSQPMGIFRPVHLVVTNEVRVEPFGTYFWSKDDLVNDRAEVKGTVELKQYGAATVAVEVENTLYAPGGKLVGRSVKKLDLKPGKTIEDTISFNKIDHPERWSNTNPVMYRVETVLRAGGKELDRVTTKFGIRSIHWPSLKEGGAFLLNGKKVFLNGTAEYEHAMGKSHAFSSTEINARVKQVVDAGYNAFRDAHQPHNLRYQKQWDKRGILWWPQFGAHIWFDNPAFRNNFKQLLRDWIKERRNSPSIILWGLENESTLPEDFARECTEIIRQMDPGASSERLVTTCNGGAGTDWDVPQNWTGTYGGDPLTYGADLRRQILVGEYGAWRSIDLHGEKGEKNGYSEEKMTEIIETKIRLADSVKNEVAGHFHWLLYSHENPGRSQSGEGFREIDRIGPVNYKGVFTLWGEPTDAFYLFRSNFVPAEKEPVVYIVSHTWPGRFTKPGMQKNISVYSNCDEVELWNDLQGVSLGRKKNKGIGTHFQWANVFIQYNVLRAVGYVKGKPVAEDKVLLHHLPEAPKLREWKSKQKEAIAPAKNRHYLYRVNCGGPDWTDAYGNTWSADRHSSDSGKWGSKSWGDAFEGVPSVFGSQRYRKEIVEGTKEWPLFQHVRYGGKQLAYRLPVPEGRYRVELYFAETWFPAVNAAGYRVFDVAVNEKIVLKNLDVWSEIGHNRVFKKVISADSENGQLVISFPGVAAGQAFISAIAIADEIEGKANNKNKVKQNEKKGRVSVVSGNGIVKKWLNLGDRKTEKETITISGLPAEWYAAEWICFPEAATLTEETTSLQLNEDAIWYAAVESGIADELPGKGWVSLEKEIAFAGVEKRWKVFRKNGVKNELLEFSRKQGKDLFIAVAPPMKMDPAFDLKPTTGYKIENTVLKGAGAQRDTLNGKNAIIFNQASGDTVQWKISVGVADVYAIRLRYVNRTNESFTARMQLHAADGTLMKETQIVFDPYLPNKWGLIHTDTGTSINAGNYTLTLISENASGLAIAGLEIQ